MVSLTAAVDEAVALGPVAVDAHPEDLSPYDVRGLAGNVCDLCQDPSPALPRLTEQGVVRTDLAVRSPDAGVRRARGGSWNHNRWWCRSDVGKLIGVGAGSPLFGFRLCRSVGRSPGVD